MAFALKSRMKSEVKDVATDSWPRSLVWNVELEVISADVRSKY